jgi:alkylation response protein AidB-like acyl-CoA dehydrogenase
MSTFQHPSTYIAPELAAALRRLAGEAEHLKQLHLAQLAIIYEQKWFQLFVPKAYGGLQLTLPEALKKEEALAWTDGAVGWTVTLCAGAGWFVGFLNPATASNVFNNKTVCLAGSGKASGIAKIIDAGYEVTGYWEYATGANCATAFTANCMMEDKGVLLKNTDGSPVIQSFLFLKDEVTVYENWKRIGMIATGSNSFEVKKIVVNKNRSFIINQGYTILKQPIYYYPFLQFAETTLAINSSGMAIRFLDLCKELFEKRATNTTQSFLKNALKEHHEARQLFYKTVAASWEACSANLSVSPELLSIISNVSKQLAITSRKVVDELYPYCGMEAANPETEINRVWRNLHTASQHSIFNG